MRPFLQLLGIFIIFFASCNKKIEVINEYAISIQNQQISERFFSGVEKSSLPVKKLAQLIKQTDSTKKFIQAFALKEGFPNWEKAIVINGKGGVDISIKTASSKSEGQSTNNKSDTIVLVPLILQNKDVVSSFIEAKINGSNIEYRTFSSRNYKVLPHGNADGEKLTAEKIALITLLLDKEVYGHTRFFIIDSSLFPLKKLELNNSLTQKFVEFKSQSANLSSVKQSDYLIDVDYDVTMIFYHCTGCNGACDLCPDCVTEYTYTLTKVILIETGGGGGFSPGFSGGTGTEGGGGNTGGFSGGEYGGNGVECSPDDACGRLGWTAEQILTNKLASLIGLTIPERQWVNTHPAEAVLTFSFLEEEMNLDPLDDGSFPIYPSQDAIIASKVAIASAMNNLISGPFDNNHWNTISSYIPNSSNYPNIPPHFWSWFKMKAAYTKFKVGSAIAFDIFLRSSFDNLHSTLDIIGLVPGIGEIADLTNGFIYTIQGEGTNATLSYLSAIPIAGWFASGVKAAGKVIDVSSTGKKVSLHLTRIGDDIHFGSKRKLREVLGLEKGNPLVAHHVIPVDLRNHDLVQLAAKGKDPFHIDELINGYPITVAENKGNHFLYIPKVRAKLDAALSTANNDPELAKVELLKIINDIRTAITNNRGTNVDFLNF
ncbi:MAG TPA: hypothetical protein DHW64_07405 [Chitinophagaceae bacterium]|nr:hypothetical protein [Chitinophagaceae bacterium]